jgi:hypothetical protein
VRVAQRSRFLPFATVVPLVRAPAATIGALHLPTRR